MATTAQQIRAWQGPAILGYGFRPFFLGAAAYAAIVMVVWIGALWGAWSVPSAYGPLEWHAHELMWGYLPAVITGFLLTAIPNWTGRLPIVGVPLAILWCFWLAGRIAMFVSGYLPVALAAVIDLSFLVVLLTVVAREIIASRNWTNLKVLAVVTVMAIGNFVFHTQAMADGEAGGGKRCRRPYWRRCVRSANSNCWRKDCAKFHSELACQAWPRRVACPVWLV